MSNDTLSFEIAGGALELVGPTHTINALRPYLMGFPLQPESKPIRVALREYPQPPRQLPRGRIPEVVSTADHDTLHLTDVYKLDLDRVMHRGTLDYFRYGAAFPKEAPKAPWLALKAYFSLHALQSNGLLIHASALNLNSTGIIFAGVSGAGKSTIAGMFPKKTVINDDIVFLSMREDGLYIVSTPFTSTPDIQRRHVEAPAQWGFSLEQGEPLTLTSLSPDKAFRLLLRSTIAPQNQQWETLAFKRSHRFTQHLKWGNIRFPLQPASVVQKIMHLPNNIPPNWTVQEDYKTEEALD